MTRTPAQAVKWANAQKTGYAGLCLEFAREAYGIPAKYEDAITAWKNAKHKHVTTDLSGAPIGALLFMDGQSPHGHVCIKASATTVRTTDSVVGHPMTYTIATMDKAYRFLGWSEDLNGVRVAGLENTNAPAKASNADAGGVDVRDLQRRLNLVFPSYSRLNVDGVYGPLTKAVVKEFQKRSGLTATGKVDAATKAALKKVGVL